MSVNRMIPVAPGADINQIIAGAAQNLQAQGFEVLSTVMSPDSATLTVKKDRDGIKNVAGLGLECRASLMIMNGTQMNVTIDHEWSNKIIALAVGWILCWVPFITGIVGCVNQNSLPEKIASALMLAANGGGDGMPQYGVPQQPQYDPNTQYSAPQQPQYDQNTAYGAPAQPYDPNQQPPQQ